MGVTSAAGGMAHDFCYHGNQARGQRASTVISEKLGRCSGVSGEKYLHTCVPLQHKYQIGGNVNNNNNKVNE